MCVTRFSSPARPADQARSRVGLWQVVPSRSSPSCCSPRPRRSVALRAAAPASSGSPCSLHRARHPASFAIEAARDRTGTALGLDPAGIFWARPRPWRSSSSSSSSCSSRRRSPLRCRLHTRGWRSRIGAATSGSRRRVSRTRPLAGLRCARRSCPVGTARPRTVLCAGSRPGRRHSPPRRRRRAVAQDPRRIRRRLRRRRCRALRPAQEPHEASRAPQHRRGAIVTTAPPSGWACGSRRGQGPSDWFASSTSPAHRVVCPHLAFGLARSRASLPVAAHPVDVLGPLGASAVEGRRGLQRTHARDRLDLGRPTWGVW